MCDIWKITEVREITAVELQRHLADIERLRVGWVVFSGGEPLMHSDLFRLAAMLRARGIRTTLLSSGLLERNAVRIMESIDEVIVSLDGPAAIHDEIRGVPGAFRRLADGVRALRGYPVAARCTVQARNATSLRATVEAAREIGLRSLSFLAADLASPAFNRPLVWPAGRQASITPEWAALGREIEYLIAEYSGDGFILETPAKLRRIAAHFRAQYGLEPHTAPRCNAPWISAVVESNGDVRPCFFHGVVGNISGGLAEAVNGPQAVAFRQSLDVTTNATCRQCVCSLYREEDQNSHAGFCGADLLGGLV